MTVHRPGRRPGRSATGVARKPARPRTPAAARAGRTVARWVEAYRLAWKTNDPAEIGRLFAAGAVYRPTPFSTPWRGRAAIVRRWLARKDSPGSTRFRYEVLATGTNVGIVRGWTRYLDSGREYANIWLLRLDARGRCREFTEWWMQRPGS